jgi:hypothetical protein
LYMLFTKIRFGFIFSKELCGKKKRYTYYICNASLQMIHNLIRNKIWTQHKYPDDKSWWLGVAIPIWL